MNPTIRKILHLAGISILGGAVFIQSLVFSFITVTGRFTAVEPNLIVLAAEDILLVSAVVYYAVMFRSVVRRVLK